MRKLYLGLFFVAMVAFIACSSGSGTNADSGLSINSSNSSSESDDEYDSIVEDIENLPKCTEGKDGEVYYVKNGGVVYTCRYDKEEKTGEWVKKKKKPADDADDQKSSSSVEKDDSSSSEKSEESSSSVGKNDSSSSEKLEESSSSVKKDDSSSSEKSEEDKSSSSGVKPDVSVVTGMMTDERDGQTYRTVKIGNQTWMAENLNYRYLGRTAHEDSSSFCYFNHPAKCTEYGRLYLWSAAMDSAGIIKGNTANGCGVGSLCHPGAVVRGVCPEGWHLPSRIEWDELLTAVGGSDVAGKMLKSETGWESYSGIENNDTYSFSALPAGTRNLKGGSKNVGRNVSFWCSWEGGDEIVWYMGLGYDGDNATLSLSSKYYWYSIRCLKD